jgi:hypothetical protein
VTRLLGRAFPGSRRPGSGIILDKQCHVRGHRSWLEFFTTGSIFFISGQKRRQIDYLRIAEKEQNAWRLFFDFHRRQAHIKKRKLLQ